MEDLLKKAVELASRHNDSVNVEVKYHWVKKKWYVKVEWSNLFSPQEIYSEDYENPADALKDIVAQLEILFSDTISADESLHMSILPYIKSYMPFQIRQKFIALGYIKLNVWDGKEYFSLTEKGQMVANANKHLIQN